MAIEYRGIPIEIELGTWKLEILRGYQDVSESVIQFFERIIIFLIFRSISSRK